MRSAQTLDTQATLEVLQRAVHSHMQTHLELPEAGCGGLNGYLVSGDERTLLLELTGRACVELTKLIDASCQAHLFCGQHYHFDTRICWAPAWNGGRSIALARPERIQVVERRRFNRASFAASSPVALCWGDSGQTWRAEAMLLNVSPCGLACRAAHGDTNLPGLQDVVRTRFRLPGDGHVYNLDATVCTRTRTPDGGVILGVKFAAGPQSASDAARLETTLVSRQPQALATAGPS